MNDITIKIQCFGALRAISDNITVSTPPQPTAKTVKQAIIRVIGTTHQPLIDSSVLATDTKVLQDTEVIDNTQHLSILPPVCGG